jgi:hypothetical protein
MRFTWIVLVVAVSLNADCAEYVNSQFHDSESEGIVVLNEGLLPKTFYARFILESEDDEREARNSGTKYTLRPKSTITYYLPPDTSVIATDGVYWDNPEPSYPEERFILATEANRLLEIAVGDLAF